jgi:uncharacterized protein with ParB-like and HNH nuclease domain
MALSENKTNNIDDQQDSSNDDELTALAVKKDKEDARYEQENDSNNIDFSKYDITTSPNDFNTKTLFDFISSNIVKIPGFQRNYVWDIKRASKFIESLIIGLPIPQIFLYQESRNNFIVIDGQQRYMTIYYFINRRFPKKDKRYELRDIFTEKGTIPTEILHNDLYFSNFTLDLPSKTKNHVNKYHKLNYETLDKESKFSFDLRTIRNVVINQNFPVNDHSAVYEIFNRLNTGGVNLKPQEIRASLYHSGFYTMLSEINKNSIWRKFTPSATPDLNMKDIEILLRGFAMLEGWKGYSPSMTRFLNSYSESVKKIENSKLILFKEYFEDFMNVCGKFQNKKIFFSENNKFSISYFESVFVASCYQSWNQNQRNVFPITEASIESLKADQDFIAASQFDTAGTANVKTRMRRAIFILTGYAIPE